MKQDKNCQRSPICYMPFDIHNFSLGGGGGGVGHNEIFGTICWRSIFRPFLAQKLLDFLKASPHTQSLVVSFAWAKIRSGNCTNVAVHTFNYVFIISLSNFRCKDTALFGFTNFYIKRRLRLDRIESSERRDFMDLDSKKILEKLKGGKIYFLFKYSAYHKFSHHSKKCVFLSCIDGFTPHLITKPLVEKRFTKRISSYEVWLLNNETA